MSKFKNVLGLGVLFFIINYFSQWLLWNNITAYGDDKIFSHAGLVVLNGILTYFPIFVVGVISWLITKKTDRYIGQSKLSILGLVFIALTRAIVTSFILFYVINLLFPYSQMMVIAYSFTLGFIPLLVFYFSIESLSLRGINWMKYQLVIYFVLFISLISIFFTFLYKEYNGANESDVYYSRKIELIYPYNYHADVKNSDWEVGEKYKIRWKSENINPDEKIVIGYRRWDVPWDGRYYLFTTDEIKNTGEYELLVPYNSITEKDGLFQITVYSPFKGTTDPGLASDVADVQIINPPTTVDLKINGSDGPISAKYDSVVTVSWDVKNATLCYPSGSGIPSLDKDSFTGQPISVWKEGSVIMMNLAGLETSRKYIARDYKNGFVPVISLGLSCDNSNGSTTKDSVQINLVR